MSLEGQQIHRYHILRLLGSGGMGDVYLAEDPRIGQQVAIKVIRAELSPYPNAQATQEATRLFQREAKAIAQLDHPHILPLYDYGEERLGNLSLIYLVMPYRREGSLSDWLRQRGQAGLLSPQEVAHVVRQAASALQHAHERQIVHQDVKPSNFLIRQRPEKPTHPDLLLADFGVARFSTATASASQTVRGTPTYMAPEQWASQPVPATDQYALAVMAYELLTGRPPFQGAPGPLMYQHLMAPVPPPSSLNPRLSTDLDDVLLHALAKKPEERFASIMAFANAFQQAVQGMQEADAPTYLSAPSTPRPTPTPTLAPDSSGDLRAVLAISTAEAQKGTTRTLTLPGGRQVTVPVPAGVHEGQIVRLEGQGETSPNGGPAGALILTILVKAAEEPPSLSSASAVVAEETVLTANTAATTSAPTISDTGQQATVSNTARPELSTPLSSEVLPTESALPAGPAVGPARELPPPTQAEQPASVAPIVRSPQLPAPVTAQPPSSTADRSLETLQPVRRGISRRTIVLGLGGLTIAGLASGITWLALSHLPFGAVTPSTSTPTPTPVAHPENSTPPPSTVAAGLANAYMQAVLNDHPSAYYRLDEISGTIAHDSSGAGYDATYIGSPGLGKPGIFGSSGDTAVQLNGDSGYVSTMNQATPLTATRGDHDRTVELWFQTSLSEGNLGYGKNLFTTGSPGHTQSFDIALIGANGPGACGSHTGAGLYVRCWDDDLHLAGLQLADSQWHYVAVTVSRGGTMVTVVVDGQQPAGYVWDGNCWTPNPQAQPFLMPFPVNTASTPIGIGNSGWTTGFNGVVGEVAIYPSALGVSELSAHHRLR